jgi:hypothetical protein
MPNTKRVPLTDARYSVRSYRILTGRKNKVPSPMLKPSPESNFARILPLAQFRFKGGGDQNTSRALNFGDPANVPCGFALRWFFCLFISKVNLFHLAFVLVLQKHPILFCYLSFLLILPTSSIDGI